MAEINAEKIDKILKLAQNPALLKLSGDHQGLNALKGVAETLIEGEERFIHAALSKEQGLRRKAGKGEMTGAEFEAFKQSKSALYAQSVIDNAKAGINKEEQPDTGKLVHGAGAGLVSGIASGDVGGSILHSIIGGLGGFIFSIPYVGELMQTASTWVSRKFSDKPVSWQEASEAVKNNKIIARATTHMTPDVQKPLADALAVAVQQDDTALAALESAVEKQQNSANTTKTEKAKATSLSISGDKIFNSEKEKTHQNMTISFDGAETMKDGKRIFHATRMTVIGKDGNGKNVLNISHDVNQDIALDAEGKLDAHCPAIKAEANKAINGYIQDLTVKLSGMMTAGQAIGSGMLPGVTVPTITAAKVIPFQAPSKS